MNELKSPTFPTPASDLNAYLWGMKFSVTPWSDELLAGKRFRFYSGSANSYCCIILDPVTGAVTSIFGDIGGYPLLMTEDGDRVWARCEFAPVTFTADEFRSFVMGRFAVA